jgi:Nucleotidyltransferase domain
MSNRTDEHRREVAALCRKSDVRHLDVFGSAVRDDFDPVRSDLDFLVKFDDMPPRPLRGGLFLAERGAGKAVRPAPWTSLPAGVLRTHTCARASPTKAGTSLHADSRKLPWDAQQAAGRIAHFRVHIAARNPR